MNTEMTFDTRDEFQRKLIAENIDKLLSSDMDLSPLMIDGNWGTGKTEFSHKLANLLLNDTKRHVIYIDAFKEDHSDSPLLSITAAIAKILPENDKKTFIQKSLPALRFGLKTAGKAGVSWLFKQEADKIADEFEDVLKEASNSAIDSTIENLLDDHINAEKNIKSLQDTLEKIAQKKQIIIIVDELDRCRPCFAVSFLEKIKHIFETKNVNFVLVANANQLKASVNHIYGESIDAQKYLDKFVKYSLTLPKLVVRPELQSTLASVSYWHHLVDENENALLPIDQAFGPLIDEMITRTNLTLRDVEGLTRHICVYQLLSHRPIQSNSNVLVNFAKLMGLFIKCLCPREIIDSFPSQHSLESMANNLGIKSLPYESNYDIYENYPILEMVFFLFIKENLPDASFLNTNIINHPINLEERINKTFGTSIVKNLKIRNTVLNTISIVAS